MNELDGTVGQHLEHDHRRIDEGFARFADSLNQPTFNQPTFNRAAFDESADALRHHIYTEEVFHFPVLRAEGLLAPVLVMLREHGEIWDLLDVMAAALDRDDLNAVRELWPKLTSTLEHHNMKEERILYPAGDQKFSAEQAALITAALISGEMPVGWTCEMAGKSNTNTGPNGSTTKGIEHD